MCTLGLLIRLHNYCFPFPAFLFFSLLLFFFAQVRVADDGSTLFPLPIKSSASSFGFHRPG